MRSQTRRLTSLIWLILPLSNFLETTSKGDGLGIPSVRGHRVIPNEAMAQQRKTGCGVANEGSHADVPRTMQRMAPIPRTGSFDRLETMQRCMHLTASSGLVSSLPCPIHWSLKVSSDNRRDDFKSPYLSRWKTSTIETGEELSGDADSDEADTTWCLCVCGRVCSRVRCAFTNHHGDPCLDCITGSNKSAVGDAEPKILYLYPITEVQPIS